jgi:cysteinyl-tRNA synthetase
MVNFIGDKMSKSVGNILDAREAVELHGRNAVRMWFLQSHYSQPIDYSGEILEEKRRSFVRLQNLYARIAGSVSSSKLSESIAADLRERFNAAMQDDFNTPEAIATLFEASRRTVQEIAARPKSMRQFSGLKEAFEELLVTILGFELSKDQTIYMPYIPSEAEVFQPTVTQGPGAEMKEKVERRERARREEDWAAADRLRDELKSEGWSVEDTPEGPILTRA